MNTINIFASKLQETPPLSFSEGLNLKSDQTQIGDNESPDMSNMINDIFGSSMKRNGSKRYNFTAISSNPINSLYRAYISTQGEVRKALIFTSKDRILISTTEAGQFITTLGTVARHNQHYNFEIMNQQVIMSSPQESTEPFKMINIVTSSMTTMIPVNPSTSIINITCKHILNSKNYLLGANCSDITNGTTNYPTRLYYSYILQPSSFSWDRYIDFRTTGKEEITGLGELFGRVHIFFPTSIFELDFSILDPDPTIGNQTVEKLVDGFGCIAPRTLVNTGLFYVFLAGDGVRIWDGGRRTRLAVADESRIISFKIEPIIREILNNGLANKSIGVYYPLKEWYVLSYIDTKKSPKNKPNSIIVYDFKNGEWFPFSNWNIESFTVFDKENGELIGGQSDDGYINYLDAKSEANDYRKELYVENMDSTNTWNRGETNLTEYKEGTGSIRISNTATVTGSSISKIAVYDFSKWNDLSQITKDDLFHFRVRPSTIGNIQSIRIDLLVDDSTSSRSDFNLNFTSITISTGSLLNENTTWTTIEISLSSFPIPSGWTDLNTEDFPFANTQTFYGLRFVLNSISTATIDLDDVRIVQNKGNPLNAFRFTKQINFGSQRKKNVRQLVLNTETSPNSIYFVDIFSDFGQLVERKKITEGFQKELYTCGLTTSGLFVLDSIDFSVKNSTIMNGSLIREYRTITDDENFVYAADRFNHSVSKINKSSFTAIVSSFGSLGSGTTNFNNVWQIATDGKNLYLSDMGNHRISILRNSDLSFVRTQGSLGIGNTSFHLPTGIAVDDRFFYVGDDGNQKIKKFDKSTGAFLLSEDVRINTFGSLVLAVDDKFLYDAYQTVPTESVDHLTIFLERRDKSSLKLLNSIEIRPKDNIAISSYIVMGNISVCGDYIYLPFTDDVNGNGNYFIQKRLASDFTLIKERKSTEPTYGVTGCGLSFRPNRKDSNINIGTESTYTQLKFSENELDNKFILNSMSFSIIAEELLEK